MIELSELEKLGFTPDQDSSNSGFLRFYGQPIVYYDKSNGGKVTLLDFPANGVPKGDYISSVNNYITALETLGRSGIPLARQDLEKVISQLQKTRAAINGFEARIQDLRAKK